VLAEVDQGLPAQCLESFRGQHIVIGLLGEVEQAARHVHLMAYRREIEPQPAADIAVGDVARMERQAETER
jgi:hypothetical protein